MKTSYFYAVVFGMLVLATTSRSQNILFDGDFSTTTEIDPFDPTSPPINDWALGVNLQNDAEASSSVIEGVAVVQIQNPGYDYPDIHLSQFGFPLNKDHIYQLSFDVKADAERYVRVFLGEEGGNSTNLIGYESWYYATTYWQTITLEFKATSVFDLHRFSLELGANHITTYFDNVILQDLGPAPAEKVVIAGTFQSALGCETDWDANCGTTELTFDSSSGLYSGTFEVPEGNHRYKVTMGGSWDINYGENGIFGGADIFLCIPDGSQEVTFTYDPVTHLVYTSPTSSGFSPDCLPIVVLAGSFQDELGCSSEWMFDCSNTALSYNSDSGLFEGDFSIPSGCYSYRIYLENTSLNSFGKDGVFNGENYDLYIPPASEVTHFTYDPISHVVTSSPYGSPPQEVTQVFLIGNFQDELGCNYDGEIDCEQTSLVINSETGAWENTFVLPQGCYTYRVREIFGCNTENVYGQNGEYWGEEIQLYVPENREIHFRYDPQTHLIESSPFSEVPQEITQVSLFGSFGQELDLVLNPDSGNWEKTFMLPAGCYSYLIEEVFGCNTTSIYGENGTEGTYNDIQLYVPEDGEVFFSYDPENHLINSTPYAAPEIASVTLTGTIQKVLCGTDYYNCDKSALMFNPETGMWEGDFTLPKGCYTYQVQETSPCYDALYGENGEMGGYIQLYIPVDGEVAFNYDPQTHVISSSPYSGTPEEVTSVSLEGSSFPNELILNPESGLWKGSFTLSQGCYTYWVKETFGCVETYYGENGESWQQIQLYVPTEAEITFTYDPQTHRLTSTPYSGNPEEATAVSLWGSLQSELGCSQDNDYECDTSALIYNPDSQLWEGDFTLPAGCYSYWVKESVGCNDTYYGEGENIIQLYVPVEGEVSFRYNAQTHTMTSTPYSGVPQEITSVSFFGDLQNELGCANDNDSECNEPALTLNTDTGLWEGSFYLPAKCYSLLVKETFTCSINYYGENGTNEFPIQLYVPTAGEITFSYDPQSHILTPSPYTAVPQEVTAVSLVGSLQSELGCDSDGDQECAIPSLIFNPDSNTWEGSFTLPAGCYEYRVKETFGCEVTYYGENGEYGQQIELYLPTEAEITFSYDPQTHLISSTPYDGVPQEVTKVSLVGTLQDELGCENESDNLCEKPSLIFNPNTSLWEGTFSLPAGCYEFRVKETFGCDEGILFGENGQESGDNIQLYVDADGEVTFQYDPQTHIISSTPYGDVPPERTEVSLIGNLQDELGCAYPGEDDCANSALAFNPASGVWEGSFTLPAGCYAYRVKEANDCGSVEYGENGSPWGEIQLFLPTEAEITFTYDPQTHVINSTPFSGVPEEMTSVSLTGTFQDKLGCGSINDPQCDKPALVYDPESGLWEGSFTLPAGCYSYWVRETLGCEWYLYGENGNYGDPIQLYVPADGEVTFSYDPETHTVISTPYSGIPQEATSVSLEGLPDGIGCTSAEDADCDDPSLQFNPDSGKWEDSFKIPGGCYFYRVKESSVCKSTFYGENGHQWPEIQLYVPKESEITFSYDPETHIITTTPYSGVPEEVTSVKLNGNFYDPISYPSLVKNETSGNWEGTFVLPAGCYTYWIEESFACIHSSYYGENGVDQASNGKAIELYVPVTSEINFSYDPQTHILTSSPYSGAPQEVTEVSLFTYDSTELDLIWSPDSGEWEGSFELAAGCYFYEVRETFGCEVTYYGENQLYLPSDGEITFSYDPQTRTITSTPYSGVPEEVTNVNLVGSLNGQAGYIPLSKNNLSGKWEGTYLAPAGCYAYLVEEIFGCTSSSVYGENGQENGNQIQLNIPLAGEVTFSYDPETHLITSTPYSGAPQEVTKVSLYGSFQNELGCNEMFDYECDKPALIYNSASGTWEGSFTLPAGCYSYLVKETIGCNIESVYGENGVEEGKEIELYVPTEGQITFSYNPQTHIIQSTPYSGVPQDVTAVSLFGSLQSETGCSYDYQAGCDGPALNYNAVSHVWEGTFTIPAGCYSYRVKETFGCETKSYYGKNGTKSSDDIWLFVPLETEITFRYDPQTHLITSEPYTDISTINQCPKDIFIDNTLGACGAIVDYPGFVATADCGGEIVSVAQTEGMPSGSFFPIGTTTNTFILTTTTGEIETCSFDIVVNDAEAPTIIDLKEIYEPLWPPNHKMVPVLIEYAASDNCNVISTELSVYSNEPPIGRGKGDQSPDWEIVDEHNVLLRAERDAKGTGREYYITIRVTDDAGNYIEEVVTVSVPLNRGLATEGTDFSGYSNDSFKLYPTPADQFVKIKGPETVSKCPYSIYDMLGVMKLQGTIHDDRVEVGNLPSGSYVLKFSTDQGIISKQFIKK